MADPNLLFEEKDSKYHAKNLQKEMQKYHVKFIFLYSCSARDEMDSFLEFEGIRKQISDIVKLDSGSEEDNPMTLLSKLLEERFKNKMQVEGGIDGEYCRILVRRANLGDKSNKSMSLERVFSEVCARQMDRIYRGRKNGEIPDDFLITKEDILGPEPPGLLNKTPAWKEMKMIGLDSVKESIRGFASLIRTNRQRELHDQPPLQVGLNRVFLGSLRTGKTTVTRLYGQILADLGVLSSGEIVIKNASDFIGQHVGGSEKTVKAAIESAKGKKSWSSTKRTCYTQESDLAREIQGGMCFE
jgi:hypothetical protein